MKYQGMVYVLYMLTLDQNEIFIALFKIQSNLISNAFVFKFLDGTFEKPYSVVITIKPPS